MTQIISGQWNGAYNTAQQPTSGAAQRGVMTGCAVTRSLTWLRTMPTSAILATPSSLSSTLGLFRSRCIMGGRCRLTQHQHGTAQVCQPDCSASQLRRCTIPETTRQTDEVYHLCTTGPAGCLCLLTAPPFHSIPVTEVYRHTLWVVHHLGMINTGIARKQCKMLQLPTCACR